MKTKEWILRAVKTKSSLTSADVAKRFGMSRQAAAKHLRELAAQKLLVRMGSTRNARYLAYHPGQVKSAAKRSVFSSVCALKKLDEDRVFQEADLKLGLRKMLSAQARRIAAYSFCEMLNNAIDHSRASSARVHVEYDNANFWFTVDDPGIGVFESVRKKFRLQNHQEAAMHLLKGKQTTFPERHSGQGIFFTSKIADRFLLESARLRLVVDNQIKDVSLMDVRNFKGTRVSFVLKRRSRKDLKELFDEYTDSNYEFDKTKIVVHLSGDETEAISRSQARRILFGLETFKRIVLDFSKVKGIGQGFADEVFRVFKAMHPEIGIETVNASPSVEFMIKRSGYPDET